ncbi:hypothetical protein OIY81_649 [Cryptosporidium canis]|uniref:TRUD domain-containing protein n=1 Tax=Cryptosporidium canis TaxID=195482 RepID=A0ABQ8P7M4_9CRYT|nr:hypothetical protein OJ252_1711 [Cryptosporidium canis]KAJ1614069.1 hypothetical protein OIY81_649 [Cryptosporidium canis]
MQNQMYHGYGIDEFIRTPGIRLRGVIKKYFEDFHVHEIKRNGDVCSLLTIRNKHDIIKEIQERKKILSGDNILKSSSVSINPELIYKLESIGVSQYDINNIITFINILGEIKKLTSNCLLNNRIFKLDSRGRLTNKFELNIKLYCSTPDKISCEDKILSSYLNDRPENNQDSINIQKEKRKKFHNLIKEYIPFVTSQTTECLNNANILNETKTFQYKDISISEEIFDEISKFVKIEELELECLEGLGRQILSHDPKVRKFDTIVLRPSNNYIYSLRDAKKNTSPKDDVNNSPEDVVFDTSPSYKKQRILEHDMELNTTTRANIVLGNNERWDPNIPDYIHFTIYKENRDTLDAINSISKCLRRNHKSFGVAGLKDRRGITVQRASAYRVSESQLIYSTASKNWDRNIRISEFKYENQQINIGDLNGNLFHVVIRDLKILDIHSNESNNENLTLENIEELVREIRSSGFINYFGLQRFGTNEIPTYKIGISLVKKEWKKAFFLILGFDEEMMTSYSTEKKEIYRQILCEDFGEYQKKLTNHSYLERLILNGFTSIKKRKTSCGVISESKEDIYRESINSLPKNSYSLYLHSLQSLFFNIIASERIRKYGKKPVIGDLVMLSNVDKCCYEDDDNVPINEKNIMILEKPSDLEKFSMQDVLLTLPGDDVVYPPILRERYDELMRNFLGFTTQENGMGVVGGYRKIIVIPDYISYIALNIDEQLDGNKKFPDSKVILSDLDILTTYPELKQILGKPEPVLSPNILEFRCDSKDSQLNTMVFSCRLPKSSYVTMALRELLGNHPTEKQ